MKLGLAVVVLTGFLFLFPIPVSAISAPVLLSPSDSSIVTTPVLNWQSPSYPLYFSNPYRVQVDDNTLFSSPDKDYYTSNTAYSPNLNDGIWYWRVRAKDSSGAASDWSSVWSFTLISATPTAVPTPTSTPTPTPTSTIAPSPTPSPSPSNTPIFTIAPGKLSITLQDSISVNIHIAGLNPNSKYYLKGAFIKEGSSNYFGLTRVSNGWVKNSASYLDQFLITTGSSGFWDGSLDIKPDGKDNGFTGNGDYIFKAGKYTESGSGPAWSNEIVINITGNPPEKSTSPSQPNFAGSVNTSSPSPNPAKSGASPKFNYPNTASVAGVSTDSSTPVITASDKEQKSNNKPNFWLLGAGLMVFVSGAGVLFYPKLKDKILPKLQKAA
ncbi:hypothetical protein HYW46_05515 [Candidatus Daviesbacteria bacterium]|nr:hypothetical protein [Candidatus Daviesbacteria bacterium]